MTEQLQDINQTLFSIAEITLNYHPDNHSDLKNAANLLSELSFDETHDSCTIFYAVKDMTSGYIEKLLSNELNDIEPVNDGVVLLRAILRAAKTGSNFVFDQKDISHIIDNLKIIETESDFTEHINNLNKALDSAAKIFLNNEGKNFSQFEEAADLITSMDFEFTHQFETMFSAVHEMVVNYIKKLLTKQTDDIEPVKEGITLLRAIVRSMKAENSFVFGNKDIADVVENLNYINNPTPVQFEPENTTDSLSEADEELSLNDFKDVITILAEEINDIIESAASIVFDDIPELGKILNELEKFENNLSNDFFKDYHTISLSLRNYIELLILGEEKNTEPIVESLNLLLKILKNLFDGAPPESEIEEMKVRLGFQTETESSEVEFQQDDNEKQPVGFIEPEITKPVTNLDDEDIEILGDFIIEAKENLESIEINLIDLEQSPDDSEIINAIFRPFHTIKGVSGFLDLRKINALSHSTENLLDSSRKGEFIIDHEITDLILKSVDVLKKLIESVEQGLEHGKTADDHHIKIKELIEQIENTNKAGQVNSEESKPVGEILIEKGAIEEEKLSEALDAQKENPEKKIGEILIEDQKVEPKEIISALREQKRGRKQSAPQVKVDTNKLDNLVDLTGELVIAQSMLRQGNTATSTSDQKLLQNLNQLGQIVSNIQKIAMSMRMVPISATFQKMVRLVRDLSRNCHKEVNLEMFGEDTEIDRNVVEALYEPMVHMIRNAIDHGLENEEERIASGKPEKGSIILRAYHKGGNIVIEITDDGKGLNKINILEKAVNSGLISPEADLDDSEIFQLIMEPGFSTAAEITDISGRGVGMDVVKKAITDLNGRVDIQSIEGQGSTFTICLPLTLAIIEGMLVRIGQEKFIIPTMAILESLRPLKKDYFTVEGKGEMLMFRNSLIPVIRLNRICKVDMDSENIWENIVVVVENKDEQRGILIDELLGKEEFVIKNLGESLKNVKGLAGGAILGDGRIGLIIDISSIFKVADSM